MENSVTPDINEKETQKELVKKTRMEFNRLYTEGNQYITINKSSGMIEEIPLDFYWQEREVYNRLQPMVAYALTINKDLTEEDIYRGEGI